MATPIKLLTISWFCHSVAKGAGIFCVAAKPQKYYLPKWVYDLGFECGFHGAPSWITAGPFCKDVAMGIRSWLNFPVSQASQKPPHEKPEQRTTSSEAGADAAFDTAETTGAVLVAGTTTFAQDAIQSMVEEHRLGERDVLETQAVLRRYPEFDNTVAVLVDNVKVGALSQAHSQTMTMGLGDERTVAYQLHVLRTDKGLRAVAYVWLGLGTPKWEFTRENPAPLTTAERSVRAQQEATRIIDEALTHGRPASEITAGMVKGYHYIELAEPIKQLKREGRLQEALVLCYEAITAAEKVARATRREPAPAYTLEAAIVHRKLGQRDEERAVLQRWIDAAPEDRRPGSRVAERLAKISN